MNYSEIFDMKHTEDQTQFAVEEPYFEDVYTPTAPVKKEVSIDPDDPNLSEEDKVILAKQQAQKKTKKMVILVVISFVVVSLVVLILIAFMAKEMTQKQILDVRTKDTQQNPEKSKVQRELDVLKNRLTEIDPIKEFLTVPPVNYKITLE